MMFPKRKEEKGSNLVSFLVSLARFGLIFREGVSLISSRKAGEQRRRLIPVIQLKVQWFIKQVSFNLLRQFSIKLIS